MATDRALLIDLRERLQDLGERVPGRAAAFHRERMTLLAELDSALSWRGLLLRGRAAAQLSPRIEGLTARGQALQALFGQIGRIEERLAAAAQALERIEDQALRSPDCIPAAAERLRAGLQRLATQVKTDEDLLADRRRCDQLKTAADALAEALALWLAAEESLAKTRGAPRTAALQAALPELGGRLCREGLTPEWRNELKGLLDPLDRLARREQPRELRETEKIVRDLPRWARLLGEDGDACAALATRFMARRKDWPGEDDRTFEELFEQARNLEQTMLDKAAAVRSAGLGALESRVALFAQLVSPDPRIGEQLRDLGQERPVNPRDHEDWCELLKEANAAFQARVKRSETELVARLNLYLSDCGQRLESAGALPRSDAQDARLARLRDTFDSLSRAGLGGDALQLLTDVERARTLRADLEALESAIRSDLDALAQTRAELERRTRALAGEEQSLTAQAALRRQALESIPPERLGHNDRGDRETMLRELERWVPDRLPDPVERLAALRELIDNADHVLKRFETAARRMQDRADALRERLRRFNNLFLRGYCPELYIRVESLVHSPAQTRWPRDAQERQLREAERQLRMLERQAQRLAAREIAEHMEILERHALRAKDADAQAVVDEIGALPPEQSPPARLRRRLAELAEAHLTGA